MIRATELDGRAVIDMDAAEKLGRIEKVILDTDARRVAGFVVGRGGSVFGSGAPSTTLPAAAVHAIGPDAVTVRYPPGQPDVPFDDLPSASDLIGRKVVSTDGRFLGTIDDVLISADNGRILGYQLADGDAMAKLGKMFGDRGRSHATFLKADADIRAGRDLFVAPEEAIADWTEEAPHAAPAPHAGAAAEGPRGRNSTSWFQGDGDGEPERGLEEPLR